MRFRRLFTCGRSRTGQNSANWLSRRISRKLELNGLQEEKLVVVQQAVSGARAGLRTARQEKARIIGELLAQQNFDRAKAMGVVAVAQQTLDDQAGRFIESLDEFHGSLSTEQRQRLAELWNRHVTKRSACCH